MTFALVVWAGVVLFALIALIAFQIVVLRVLAEIRIRRQRQLERVWLPLLMSGLDCVPDSLPRVRRLDVRAVLGLWNRVHSAITGSAKMPLVNLALTLGLDRAARRMFSCRDL